MNVLDLFKRKRVVGWDEYGRRRAHSLKQDQAFHDRHSLKKVPSFDEMLDDIKGCASVFQLVKCRFFWSVKAEEYKWPFGWIEAAEQEFDNAEQALIEAQAAQQAE